MEAGYNAVIRQAPASPSALHLHLLSQQEPFAAFRNCQNGGRLPRISSLPAFGDKDISQHQGLFLWRTMNPGWVRHRHRSTIWSGTGTGLLYSINLTEYLGLLTRPSCEGGSRVGLPLRQEAGTRRVGAAQRVQPTTVGENG